MLDRILLDMDGVLYNWEDNLRRLAAAEFGEELPAPTSTWKLEWMEKHHWKWYHDNPWLVFGAGEPYPGAVAGAAALAELTSELCIITSGEPGSEAPKLWWLQENGIEWDTFIRTTPHGPKASVLEHVDETDLFIDDAPHVIDDVIQNTRASAIVVDRPYNRGDAVTEWPNPRIYRAQSWHAIVRIAKWYAERHETRASA